MGLEGGNITNERGRWSRLAMALVAAVPMFANTPSAEAEGAPKGQIEMTEPDREALRKALRESGVEDLRDTLVERDRSNALRQIDEILKNIGSEDPQSGKVLEGYRCAIGTARGEVADAYVRIWTKAMKAGLEGSQGGVIDEAKIDEFLERLPKNCTVPVEVYSSS